MDAYIISLNDSKELIKKVSNYGLNAILLKGVNGKKLSVDEINENTSHYYSILGPRSAIGIGMSHINAWKQFLQTNKENCIILEDDALFEDNFMEKLTIGLNNTPDDYDMLYIGCFGCQSKYNYHTIIRSRMIYEEVNDYISIPGVVNATHGYIISRKGAEKLIKYLDKNIYNHIDGCINDLYFKKLLTIYVLKKRIVYQSSTDTLVSTNTSNTHPYIISKLLSQVHLDVKLRGNYDLSMSQFQIGSFIGTPATFIFLFIGIICAYFKIDIINITGFYILLNIPDIYYGNNDLPVTVHYILLILPVLLSNYIDKK